MAKTKGTLAAATAAWNKAEAAWEAYIASEEFMLVGFKAAEERIALLEEALGDIVNASRDDGLAAMCNWMRGRASAALAAQPDKRRQAP